MLPPRLNVIQQSREMISNFRGYNHNPVIGDNEFSDTINTSARLYPCLTNREKRYKLFESSNIVALGAQSDLYWVRMNGSAPVFCFYKNGAIVEYDIATQEGLAGEETRTCVNMGAYVCVFPDKWYINLNDPTDRGRMYAEEEFPLTSGANLTLIIEDSGVYNTVNPTESATAPSKPADGAYWLDTSDTYKTLYQWSASQKQWATRKAYIKIPLDANSNGKTVKDYFAVDDWVTISGFSEARSWLNNTFRVERVTASYIAIDANRNIKPSYTAGNPVNVSLERKIKDMDFVVCMNNRLWGCSSRNHEIYACKQGDFKNWDSYAGVAIDSYAVTDASSGQYTGACVYNSSVFFFKQDKIIRISGTLPSNFTTTVIDTDGIPYGSGSPVVIDDLMYYPTRNGIMVYNGAQPTNCSDALALQGNFSAANLYSSGRYLYLNLRGRDMLWTLFCYDTIRDIWHKHDNLHITSGVEFLGTLAYVSDDLAKVKAISYPYDYPRLPDDIEQSDYAETRFNWSVTTGDIGLDYPDNKYCSRLDIRFSGGAGSTIEIYAQYGTERNVWQSVWSTISAFSNTKTVTVPILPHRCDTMRLKFVCHGDITIYSITKTMENAEI